ncbi:rNA polymerase sigma factor [Firmicutes bacterium CAG:582]|nr:rNA polymerase sigma factor [Firmicutes bacterium CAG:582]
MRNIKKIVEINGINTNDLKVLSKEEMDELFKKFKEGDTQAKEKIATGNLRLVLSIIKKYNNGKNDMNDLFQIGCVGLMKAIENFDSSFNCLFSTYAVPLILGEVKRYIRDSNTIRVTRSIRDLAYKIMKYKDLYQSIHGVEPKNEDILMELGITEYELKEAYDSLREPMSIYDPIYNDGGDTIYLLDQLKDEKYDNIDKDLIISLNRALKYIKTREKNILISRYIVGKTQMELASELGVSQAQISRIEKNAINNVKKYIK